MTSKPENLLQHCNNKRLAVTHTSNRCKNEWGLKKKTQKLVEGRMSKLSVYRLKENLHDPFNCVHFYIWKSLIRDVKGGFTVEVMFEQKQERRPAEQGSRSILGTYVVDFPPNPRLLYLDSITHSFAVKDHEEMCAWPLFQTTGKYRALCTQYSQGMNYENSQHWQPRD